MGEDLCGREAAEDLVEPVCLHGAIVPCFGCAIDRALRAQPSHSNAVNASDIGEFFCVDGDIVAETAEREGIAEFGEDCHVIGIVEVRRPGAFCRSH